MFRTAEALTAQYLNVCQRKLGTIIIQTVHILQHDSAVTGSLPERDIFAWESRLLPNNLARQKYRYISVPIETAIRIFVIPILIKKKTKFSSYIRKF
jgi:hypothetical protein